MHEANDRPKRVRLSAVFAPGLAVAGSCASSAALSASTSGTQAEGYSPRTAAARRFMVRTEVACCVASMTGSSVSDCAWEPVQWWPRTPKR
jgi:hypothetical protein